AITLAMPSPSSTVTPMTWTTLLFGSNVVNRPIEAVTSSSPAVTTTLFPIRCTQMFDNGANVMIVAACGSRTAPAFTVEYPRTDCRYWVRRNSVPNSDRNVSVIAPLAALKRGFSKNFMSSIGCVECSSDTKNAASSTAPITNPVTIPLDAQPFDGASITDHSSEPSARIDSSAPIGSSCPCDGSRDSGMSM